MIWAAPVLLLSSLAAAQTQCFGLYIGSDGPPDLPKAYSCFKADGDLTMMALMTFNGEGARRDSARAEGIASRAAEPDGCPECDGNAQQLLALIQERKASGERIDFSEIARTSVEMRLGARASMLRAKRALEASAPKTKAVRALVAAFESYAPLQAAFDARNDAGGTTRPQELDADIQDMTETFRRYLEADLARGPGPAPSAEDLASADRDLDAAAFDLRETLSIEDRQALEKTERAWLRLRRAWAAVDPSAGLSLTRDRTAALRRASH